MTSEEFERLKTGQSVWVADYHDVYRRKIRRRCGGCLLLGKDQWRVYIAGEVFLTREEAFQEMKRWADNEIMLLQEKIDIVKADVERCRKKRKRTYDKKTI